MDVLGEIDWPANREGSRGRGREVSLHQQQIRKQARQKFKRGAIICAPFSVTPQSSFNVPDYVRLFLLHQFDAAVFRAWGMFKLRIDRVPRRDMLAENF
jgi:hypothetical protein